MYEILHELSSTDIVLDLGCNLGSFPESATRAFVVRVDLGVLRNSDGACVTGDAARLPFRDGAFAAVIANHSLEHFEDLAGALREMGRVVRRDGALFVAVPDASTFTDRLYRWLGDGGGHVNAFTSAEQVIRAVRDATGFECCAVRTLCSSLAILGHRPRQLRVWLVGGGSWASLFLYNFVSRRVDSWSGSRWSLYGWAFWFGDVRLGIDTGTWRNVCLGCGSGFPARELSRRIWRCSGCGAWNPYSRDY